MLELAFRPDGGAVPVYRQLADYLRDLISAGRMVAGEKLPATRELAAQLRISRNTVNHAYRALLEDGVLVAHVGQGTFVAARPIGSTSTASVHPVRGFAWEGLLSSRARRGPASIPRVSTPAGQRPRFDFLGGRVDVEVLPQTELRRVWSRVVGEQLASIANGFDPLGWGPLREEISIALVARGITCDPEDVLVVSGAQQALDLVARVLIDPGDSVVIEQPGYFGAANVFAGAGADLVGVGVDGDGLRTDELARMLRSRRAKLIYTTPSAQFPTGAVLSESRREALLELADQYHVPIFEDDYDSELRFGGPPLPALKTRDPAGRVIYVGTFSKALFPGLRVGYVVAARPLLRRLATARALADMGCDAISQAVVAELLATGALERHVRRLRRVHASRRAAMLDALEEFMPSGVTWTRPDGGHVIWVTLPQAIDPDALAASAGRRGIGYGRGDGYVADLSGARSMALAFVNQPEDRLRAGISELALVVRQQMEEVAA